MNEDNTKHTPGPWYVNTAREVAGCNGDVAVVNEDNGIVAAAFARFAKPEETLANARMLAAAPELYEALADCYVLALAWASTYAESHGLPMGEQAEPHATILKNSRAALRKAEGRS